MSDNEIFPNAAAAFARLMDIVDELRQKCPWDMKQTKESIRHLTIEETYELSDAILADDYEEMKMELGDLLMHMVFYASMARDEGKFDLKEALEKQISKLIRRHPHIYGDMVGASEEEINANWEKIKAQERASQGVTRRSALAGVPKSLPALIQAQRMQEKASGVGFDWDNADDVWNKVLEEMTEFELAEGHDRKEAEMGDLLFALVNYCRHQGINPEDALARTNRKFQYRFHYIEKTAWYQDKEIDDLSMEEMDHLWEEAKKDER